MWVCVFLAKRVWNVMEMRLHVCTRAKKGHIGFTVFYFEEYRMGTTGMDELMNAFIWPNNDPTTYCSTSWRWWLAKIWVSAVLNLTNKINKYEIISSVNRSLNLSLSLILLRVNQSRSEPKYLIWLRLINAHLNDLDLLDFFLPAQFTCSIFIQMQHISMGQC